MNSAEEIPIHSCNPKGPPLVPIDVTQCQAALRKFPLNKDGKIELDVNTQDIACGTCKVTLEAMNSDENVLTSVGGAQTAISNVFKVCNGAAGYVVIDIGTGETSTEVVVRSASEQKC
ncbi:uncharacterized protein MELLADRAFT_103368 [Melampsora larici-populina 98AG31]|uniref:Uncharacterized protein n=1 Tax=Melampsora larici-populina (strain 98AG31 / pathotype 3-4-7) TaxID=747676 RepID=F4RB86_MELLP|nr:uncharacterized protein MELLADRAFT_103368 [Melampsora larici-populina 98AG31]EGG10401.1 hypothetical protein MELLADRAFT_103368 [Melampsora larici-populina 98AG31]